MEWKKKSPPTNDAIIYTVFLIGDTGAPKLVGDPTLALFSNHLKNATKNSTAIFLGDNIYTIGLPDSSHPKRLFYENRLIAQLKTVDDFKGKVVFIPGNHDWDNGGADGLQAIQ